MTMTTPDEDWLIDDDEPATPAPAARILAEKAPWKVLVVDDDSEVHAITRLVIRDLVHSGRGIELIDTYSADEALAVLRKVCDVAVILLDVVMETDQAGLDLVKTIRDELHNCDVRVILRTGQPGIAPERDVIDRYEINDYKAKAELTAQQLYTATLVALRAYEHIRIIERSRAGLEKIIEASSDLFKQHSIDLFATGVLTQLGGFMQTSDDGILCARLGDTEGTDPEQPYVLAGSGRFADIVHRPLTELPSMTIPNIIRQSMIDRQHTFGEQYTCLFLPSANERDLVIYFDTPGPTNEIDRRLLEVFCAKVAVGHDNSHLFQQLKIGQQATVIALADLAEHKDIDTGEHVMRVAKMTERIAKQLATQGEFSRQLTPAFLEHIGMASMLHDVGKVAIPDAVLRKPGPLSDTERTLMQTHAHSGGALLAKAARRYVPGSLYLSMAADIANHHHEWFNGNGYPIGLRGDDIPLAARIVSVADVYDALVSRRPYKAPWQISQAVDFIRERAGTQFDPQVVNAFLAVESGDGNPSMPPSGSTAG